MSDLEAYSNKIGAELTGVLSRVEPQQLENFLNAIQKARKIALYAGGREGLMIRALAMRLFHLGYDVSVVGDMTAPFLTQGDLLILSVGPGYVSTVDALRSVAQRDKATVVCLTAQPEGKTPTSADRWCTYLLKLWRMTLAGKPRRFYPWGVFTSSFFLSSVKLSFWNY